MTETTAPETTTPALRTRPSKLQPCYCRTFEVGETTGSDEGGDLDQTIETTGCTRQTNRTFAQGHDAKLVSFLVAAELDGKEIRYGRDSGIVVHTDAVGACKMVSPELAAKAERALINGKTKLERKAQRAAEKAQRKAERELHRRAKDKKDLGVTASGTVLDGPREVPVQVVHDETDSLSPAEREIWGDETQAMPVPQLIQGKVGRWTYDGTVGEDGSFTYTNGSGTEVTVESGKWSQVN